MIRSEGPATGEVSFDVGASICSATAVLTRIFNAVEYSDSSRVRQLLSLVPPHKGPGNDYLPRSRLLARNNFRLARLFAGSPASVQSTSERNREKD